MASKLYLELLKPSQYDIWDDLVDRSPQGTVFHKSWWLKHIANHQNTNLHFLGVFREDELVGGCSIYEEKKFCFKLAFSPPINSSTPYGGIIAVSNTKNVKKDESLNKSIIGSVSEYCLEHYDYSQILNSPTFVDVRPFIWNGWGASIRYTYLLCLKDFSSSKDLAMHYDGSVRWSINKADKNSVSVNVVNDSAELIYDLLAESYVWHRQDVPISKELLTMLLKELKSRGICKTYFAFHNDRPISFGVFLFYNNTAYYWLGGSRRETSSLEGPSAVLGRALADALNDNISFIDFVGANTPSIAKFKSAFNPVIYPYYLVEHVSLRAHIAKEIYGSLRRYPKNRSREGEISS